MERYGIRKKKDYIQDEEIVELLLKKGVNPLIRNKDDETPLDLLNEEGDKSKNIKEILTKATEEWKKKPSTIVNVQEGEEIKTKDADCCKIF